MHWVIFTLYLKIYIPCEQKLDLFLHCNLSGLFWFSTDPCSHILFPHLLDFANFLLSCIVSALINPFSPWEVCPIYHCSQCYTYLLHILRGPMQYSTYLPVTTFPSGLDSPHKLLSFANGNSLLFGNHLCQDNCNQGIFFIFFFF